MFCFHLLLRNHGWLCLWKAVPPVSYLAHCTLLNFIHGVYKLKSRRMQVQLETMDKLHYLINETILLDIMSYRAYRAYRVLVVCNTVKRRALRCQRPVGWDGQLVWHDRRQNTKSEEDSGQVNTDGHRRAGLNLGSLTLNPSLEYKSTDSPSVFCKNNSESNPFAKFESIYSQDQRNVNCVFCPLAKICLGCTLIMNIEIINLLCKTHFD